MKFEEGLWVYCATLLETFLSPICLSRLWPLDKALRSWRSSRTFSRKRGRGGGGLGFQVSGVEFSVEEVDPMQGVQTTRCIQIRVYRL